MCFHSFWNLSSVGWFVTLIFFVIQMQLLLAGLLAFGKCLVYEVIGCRKPAKCLFDGASGFHVNVVEFFLGISQLVFN